MLLRTRERVLSGVCGGIATWLGWEPWTVRISFLVLSLLAAVVPGIVVYLILWAVMPEEA